MSPLLFLNTKVKELLLKVFHVHVIIVEFESQNEVFALEKHLVHFSDTLDCVDFLNEAF